MRYDPKLIEELCREIGLTARMASDHCVEIELGQGAVLCFQNADDERDCLIGLRGIPWHAHGNIGFAAHGNHVELDYLDLVLGLKEGRVLLSVLRADGRVDQWLIHSKYNDEFQYLGEGEQIVVRRATASPPSETSAIVG
jgi:hypothetical protein